MFLCSLRVFNALCRLLQDDCVSRMAAGSRLYQGLLGVLSDRLSGLSDLWADLRDLLTRINKVAHTPDVTSWLSAAECVRSQLTVCFCVCVCFR